MEQNGHGKGTYRSSSHQPYTLVTLGLSMAALRAVGWNEQQILSLYFLKHLANLPLDTTTQMRGA
eukprot:scaffold172470_cov22-Prasinocladus_malaysianus.AAC.1